MVLSRWKAPYGGGEHCTLFIATPTPTIYKIQCPMNLLLERRG